MRRMIWMAIWILVLPIQGTAAGKARNIIFMVPDGLGLSNVTAARLHKYGIADKRLHFETLKEIGYQSTHSGNSLVTDSAAAASAWACGEKFRNGEISAHGPDGEVPPTILEIAAEMGKGTGLVATAAVTHATPAAFGAHVFSRKCQREIARQLVEETRVDVMLGAGRAFFSPGKKDPCGTGGDFIQLAQDNGYRVVYDREAMRRLSNRGPVLGLFADRSMTPMVKREKKEHAAGEPTLAEMTRKALSVLEKEEQGFFLLVEGSQIDWANHGNKPEYQISETLAFDEAVKEVLDWTRGSRRRQESTLIIVVPDHDTGGFAITGPYGRLVKAGEMVEPGWVSGRHTAVDTMIWSEGPYSQYLGRAIDNTEIFRVMKAAMKGEEVGSR